MRIIAVIPARYEAQRFPGKLLADLSSKTVLQRTYEAVQQTKLFDEVWVATDSDAIATHIKTIGGQVYRSQLVHDCGSNRVAECAEQLDADVIINVQGDEPFMPIEVVNGLIETYIKNTSQIVTAAHRITKRSLITDPNCVKAIIDDQSCALDFLRNIDYVDGNQYYQHIGIYGYSMAILRKLIELKPTPNEIERKLEQLRFLDNGFKIHISKFDINIPPGIDTKDDVQSAIKYINNED